MSPRRPLTRAEVVRNRRRQWMQKRQAQATEVMRRPPPITTRSETGLGMSRKGARPSAQRRYQAAINMPGVQVRMPAITLPRVSAAWRLVSVFMVLLLGTLIYLAWTMPEFRVVQPQVSGNQMLSTAEIDAVLNLTGRPIFSLIPSELETRLRLNYPELTSAQVAIDFPNTVLVRVSERKPVIEWQLNGGFTWIDDQGVAFRPRGSADRLISVVASAAPPSGHASAIDPLSPIPYISADMVKAIEILAPQVPAGSPISYDPHYGLGWTDSRGWRVFFGNQAKDMNQKLEIYQALVASLTQRGIYPALISVQYPDAPFYRMSQ